MVDIDLKLKHLNERIYFQQLIIQCIDQRFQYQGLHQKTQEVIKNLSDNQIKHYLEYLSHMSKYSNRIIVSSSVLYLPFVLHLLLRFIETRDQESIKKYYNILFDGILKLFNNRTLIKIEIEIIIKVIIIMSILPRKKLNNQTLSLISLNHIINSNIKKIEVFYLAVDFIIKANSEEFTNIFCDFCVNNVIKNKTNLFYLSKDIKMLSLLQITNTDKQINLLAKLYMNRYSKLFLNPYLNNIKKALSTPNDSINSFLSVLKNQTDLLSKLNQFEAEEMKKQTIIISKGFVMNNAKANEILIPVIDIKTHFTLLFSFNFSPNNNDDINYPILILKSNHQPEQKISFSIQKNLFIISALDVKNKNITEIKNNNSYQVYFSIKDRKDFQVVITSNKITIPSFTFAIKSILHKEFSLILGKDQDEYFEGYIGSVILYKTIFNEEFKNHYFALKGNYDIINYIANYNRSFISKYIKEHNDLSENNSLYSNALSYFESNKEIAKYLICCIAPLNPITNINKRVFKNIFNANCQEIYVKEPSIENEGIFFFENKNTILEFLKYEGFNLLILYYELYTKLIDSNDLSQISYDLIEVNVSSLFKLTIEILNNINIELFIKEIKGLVFSLQKYFHKVGEKGKLKGELFNQLNDWLISLSIPQNEQVAKCHKTFIAIRNQFSIFLLNSSLYNPKDYETLDYLFTTFIKCIESKKEGLLSHETLKKYLKFRDIYNNFDSTIQYKKVKKNYNNSITTMLKMMEKDKSLPIYYNTLFKTIYNKYDYEYKEYQMLQIFYLNVDNYYNINTEATRQKATKYFIKLLESMNENNNLKLTVKKKEIIKAICIRIILEYPLAEYNIIEEKNRNNTRQYSSLLDMIQSETTCNTDKLFSNPSESYGNMIMCHSHHSSSENIDEDEMKYINKYNSFQSICDSIKKASDFIIKSLLLVILEHKQLPTKTKLDFIKHCNKYNSFDCYQFITLTDYSSETQVLFLPIVSLIEKNKRDLCLSYKMIIYLIINVAKLRYHNPCVFNHFLSSKKICSKVLLNAQYNFEAYDLLQKEFVELTKIIIPYHKASFIYHFVKSVFNIKGCEEQGFYFLNLLLKYQHSDSTSKYCYHYQIKITQLLYEIFRHKKINESNFVSLDTSGLKELFKSNLSKTRFNILQNINDCNKKKTYLEVLFDILFKAIKYSKDKQEYETLFRVIFHVNEDPCYQNDDLYYNTNYKKLDVYKIFDDYYKEIKCPSIIAHFLMKYIIYLNSDSKLEYMSQTLIEMILDISAKAYENAKVLFDNKRKCRKSTSKTCKLYNLVVDLINNSLKDSKYNRDDLLFLFKEKWTHDKIDIKSKPEWFTNDNMINSLRPLHNEINDSSLLSCDSSKEQKNKCLLRKKLITKRKPFNPNLNYFYCESSIENEKEIKLQTVIDLSSVTFSNEVVLFPKDNLLLKVFGIYFKDVYFYNETFTKMKKDYAHTFLKDTDIKEPSLNFPSIIKNYTPRNIYFKGLFMRQNIDFFNETNFKISHPYYMEYITNKIKNDKRLFPPKNKTDLMIPLLAKELLKKYYCELITNHGSIFGHIKIFNDYLYFENLNREEEIDNLSEKDKYAFLFHSDTNDWLNVPKKILIFKKQIYQLFSRRFLHLFQASEIFMQNGKSYFFNFFNDSKNSDFVNTFMPKPSFEIIRNNKEDFKIKDYTKKWLNGQISNVDYLLFINKYALRSYNDISQYPVFPWLTLSEMKDRLLEYPAYGQTESQREELSEKYKLLLEQNNQNEDNEPQHHQTHFSSAYSVLFYLIRLYPYINNQIVFQKNKLDAPARQFNSIEDSLSIFQLSKDPRELIPEFFMIIDYFYNINYAFFGHKKELLIHNLVATNKMSPIEYYFDQRNKMNSPAIKSELHKFIDQVFGIKQRQLDSFNIFKMSSYQFDENLTDTVLEGTFEEIEHKIDTKIAEILMGQTPYKLLEENHPVWLSEYGKKQEEYFDMKKLFNKKSKKQIVINHKILSTSMHVHNKKHLVCLLLKTNHKDERYVIKIMNTFSFDVDYTSPSINKRISMLEKIKIDNKFIGYKYNPKYVMFNFQMTFFFIGRFLDNSFMIISSNKDTKTILAGSFVTCIIQSNKHSKDFITGHMDGRIVEWSFRPKLDDSWENKLDSLGIKRTLLAHEKEVTSIYTDDSLGLLITSGNDHYIYIRKYYDFEMLSVIQIDNYSLYEIKLNNNMLYILFYDEKIGKYIIKLFNLNGLELANSDYDYYNNIDIEENGNIIVGLSNEKRIMIFNQTLQIISSSVFEYNEKPDKNFNEVLYMGESHVLCSLSNNILLKHTLNK